MSNPKCEICVKTLKSVGHDWQQYAKIPIECPQISCEGVINHFEITVTDDRDLVVVCGLCGLEIGCPVKREKTGEAKAFGFKGSNKYCSQRCANKALGIV